MTERSESERAELVAIADQIDVFIKYGTNAIFEPDDAKKIASALRRLAAQDQKPVAWINGCNETALAALRYLADNDRPQGGEQLYNSIHLLQIASELECSIARHNAPPDSGAGKSDDVTRATAYAESLAVALWEKFDKSEAPQWKPLSGDLIGLLTQIDNMTTGLVPDHGGADAGVVVKPLKWRGPLESFPSTVWEAKTAFGHYVIEEVSASDCPAYEVRLLTELVAVKDTVDEAEAAAQADYAQRILSALSHQPAPVAADASAEAREDMADWSDLPKDIYVVGAQRVNAVGFDVHCCSVPMVMAPEVRYVRADMIAVSETSTQSSDNASAEARLREALENTNQLLIDVMHDQEADIIDRASQQFDKNIDALSKPAPVAADASAEARLREALRDLVALVSTDSRYDDSESLRSARNILFAENKAAMLALSAHPHASDCFASVTVPASGIAKLMDAVENPKQPNEALKKLMRPTPVIATSRGSGDANLRVHAVNPLNRTYREQDIPMTSIKEALERLRRIAFKTNSDIDKKIYYGALSKAYQNGDLVPATLQPDGERREAIARIICYWDAHGTCHDNYCIGSCRAKKPNAEFFKAADEILASGLVQDEAGIRRDEREKLRKRLDSHLNDFLCGMKEGWDDSVSGFNDAWDVVRKVFVAAIRSARDGGAS